jgi:hypothetical protein
MFSTLLEDDTDTLFESGIDTIKHLPSRFVTARTQIEENERGRRIERFNNLEVGSVTLGMDGVGGSLIFKPGASGSFYTLQNAAGGLNLSRAPTLDGTSSNFMSLSEEGEFTLLPLKKTTNSADSDALVPVVVDVNGKLVRGYGLYQTITGFSSGVASLTSGISELTISTFNVLSDLTTRIAAVEAATPNVSPTAINNRLSTIETLGQKLRGRMNDLNLFSPNI